ncbi:hypothetical protein CAPTEDRAFT_121424 [Capitella teleta]|uniref:C2H2-type domain-containing protein n=1 Tax=Capitella teleta TaxID=283909 RepID=R7TSQ6_CAPTE|nr:hypothetical protein CAPTEDRAFT_121424 [Capitella teleta]|eukprot:ELT96684.1 hypothetical protein CAPTEDRAFT_121424 [Capitella teleta]
MDHHQEQVSTTSADEHQEHVVTITDSEPSNTDPHQQVACTICNRIYKNEHDLQMHMGMHTETSYKCTQCGKTYRSSGPLKRHTMLVHSGEALVEEDGDDGVQKQFSCNICHKIFEHKSNLTQHMRVHAGGQHSCQMCTATFTTKGEYTTHMRTHRISYDCNVCHETFSEAKYLVKHRRLHTGEKPCQCGHCGESFADEYQLKTHMLVHTVERLSGTRRHECCVCHKTFRMRDELKAHMLLHTRGGPYECPQCGQACTRPQSLINHLRFHAGSKPFVCWCGSAFSTKGGMTGHKRRKRH